jgi:hypothetical protein
VGMCRPELRRHTHDRRQRRSASSLVDQSSVSQVETVPAGSAPASAADASSEIAAIDRTQKGDGIFILDYGLEG